MSESDSVPETKKMKLSESCETLTGWQRDMMKGEMLSDILVNIAQSLLKKQFPNFNRLQLGSGTFCFNLCILFSAFLLKISCFNIISILPTLFLTSKLIH